jgi:LemA protein
MIWGILIFVAVAALAVILIYNGLVGRRQNCRQGWADIDAQLKQRHDLIPNLVETVKGYAAHEKSTLDEVIAARNSAITAQGPKDAAAAEAGLSGALKNLFALSEGYPDLKANVNFQTLQNELADVEDKLAAARRAFNAAAADYNGAREAFPAVMFASALGFAEQNFWEIPIADRPATEAVPKISF